MTLGFLRAFVLALIKVPMILLGIPLVLIGTQFTRQWVTDTGRTITRLPQWLLPWDNIYDGLEGDKRGWWANYCLENYKKPATHWYCMWMWAGFRNPANYFSRITCGVDISGLNITSVATHSNPEVAPYKGWYLLRGVGAKKQYPRFYLQWAIKDTYGLMIDLGWKIKLSHNDILPSDPEKDRMKGLVWVISPWKELS